MDKQAVGFWTHGRGKGTGALVPNAGRQGSGHSSTPVCPPPPPDTSGELNSFWQTGLGTCWSSLTWSNFSNPEQSDCRQQLAFKANNITNTHLMTPPPPADTHSVIKHIYVSSTCTCDCDSAFDFIFILRGQFAVYEQKGADGSRKTHK